MTLDGAATGTRSRAGGSGQRIVHEDGTATWVHLFGPEESLFGALHEPSDLVRAAVVICSPVCAEMPRNYRREVLLGRELARRGIATLRFHYRGTGNSAGESEELGLGTMIEDATEAIGCLGEMAGEVPVAVVGTRVGAVVAAAAAANVGGRPMVLWDPVIDAGRYFREVFRARLITDLKQGTTGDRTATDLVEELERTGWVEVAGYPITLPLYAGLSSTPLAGHLGPGTGPVLVVEMNRQGRASRPVTAAVAEWRERGVTVTATAVDHVEAWWFGASARDGAVEAQVAGEAVVPLSVGFLDDHAAAVL
jgi:hypothetical protein